MLLRFNHVMSVDDGCQAHRPSDWRMLSWWSLLACAGARSCRMLPIDHCHLLQPQPSSDHPFHWITTPQRKSPYNNPLYPSPPCLPTHYNHVSSIPRQRCPTGPTLSIPSCLHHYLENHGWRRHWRYQKLWVRTLQNMPFPSYANQYKTMKVANPDSLVPTALMRSASAKRRTRTTQSVYVRRKSCWSWRRSSLSNRNTSSNLRRTCMSPRPAQYSITPLFLHPRHQHPPSSLIHEASS